MDAPKLSVIVPCYNCGPFLKETLDSVIVQTFQNWECIIVDNGSTDDSKKIAEAYAQKDKRFVSLSQANKGVSAARNTGILNSKGKYLLPLDADDKIAPGYIEQAVNVLENDAGIKLVYCEAELFGDSSGKWKLPVFSMKQLLIENLLFCSACFRRADFDMTKGYNESMVTGFEDWDFWLNLVKEDKEVFRIPQVLFFYRIRKNSRNTSLDYEKQKMLRRQIYENHKEKYASELNISDLIFEYYLTKNKYNNLAKSFSYGLGKMLLAPVHTIKKLFNK